MYYRLDTDGAETVYMEKETGQNSHVGLQMGRIWDVTQDEIELPYRFMMSVVRDKQPTMYGWFPGSHLMQDRLVEVLRSAGVDNLQTFPAEIVREGTDEKVPGYVVANVLGRISCADLPRCNSSPLAGRHYFHKLVIDANRARDFLMFRLHESPMVVLVNEAVAKRIQAVNFLGLTLEPVLEST